MKWNNLLIFLILKWKRPKHKNTEIWQKNKTFKFIFIIKSFKSFNIREHTFNYSDQASKN